MTDATHPFDALMEITARPPVVFVRGAGSYLWDDSRKRYLDFVQGWAVNALGHSPPAVAEALAAQAKLLLTPSPAFYNGPSLKLAKALVENSCFDQVFFANSGAEANEGAIKLARKYGAKYKNGAFEIITFEGGFHGRTLATMSASGKKAFEPLFEPKVSGFRKAKLNDLDSVKALISDNTVAVMLEPIQGEAGVWPATDQFLQGVARADQRARPAADRRRDPDRHGPHRKAVPLRTCRHRARHHDARQGHRRRRAAGRPARDRRMRPASSTATRAAPSTAIR